MVKICYLQQLFCLQKIDADPRTRPLASTLKLNLRTMTLGHLGHDGKTQPAAALAAAQDAIESFKHAFAMRLRYPRAIVLHAQHCPVLFGSYADGDVPPAWV